MNGAAIIGASGGIGRALTLDLLSEGAFSPVYALSRAREGIGDAVPLTIDITDEASIAAAAGAVAKGGELGLIIVSAGLLHGDSVEPEKSIRSVDADVMARVFAVNTIGPALVAKHFVPLLRKRGRAVFACLSARVGSISDNRLGGWYAYRASKAALNQIIRTLAIEVARSRPDAVVIGLHPGTVATGLSRPFRQGPPGPGLFSPGESARHLLNVVRAVEPTESGSVFAWDGTVIPP